MKLSFKNNHRNINNKNEQSKHLNLKVITEIPITMSSQESAPKNVFAFMTIELKNL